MGAEKKNMSSTVLQIRMTAFVTSVVLLVSAVVLVIIAVLIRRDYEAMLDERISDDLTAITQNMEQRMMRMEDAAATMSGIASRLLKERKDMDSLLYCSAGAIEGVRGVSMTMRKGYMPGIDGYYVRYAHFDAGRKIILDTYVHSDEIENNPYWKDCYGRGLSEWTEPTTEPGGEQHIVCHIVPVYNAAGERIGIFHVSVPLTYITSFVTAYKLRNDIDISVYSPGGKTVVAPDNYISEIPAKDLITRECSLDHLGWKVILSADRRVVDKVVRQALLSLSLLILMMFAVMSLAIRLTVKFVAKPFIERQTRTEKEKAVVDNELRLAAVAQNELVPHVFPPFPSRREIDLSACLHPARDVGGDLYDYFLNGDSLYFCIGDVSGKGLQASLFMAATHYLFRSVAAGMPSGDAVGQMNISLCTDNAQCRFVTFWFGRLNLSNGELEYVNAGHDAPILLRGGRAEMFPSSENMPLGVWDEAEFVSCSTVLEPGDMLLLYTDGVTEAMDADGHEFGRQKLLDVAGTACVPDASGLIGSVLGQVRQHASGVEQSDDITMLCLKFIKTETTI